MMMLQRRNVHLEICLGNVPYVSLGILIRGGKIIRSGLLIVSVPAKNFVTCLNRIELMSWKSLLLVQGV